MPTIKEIGFGAVISKNLSTANSILRKLHSDISETSVETFYEIGLDAFELQPAVVQMHLILFHKKFQRKFQIYHYVISLK